ncbi:MAG: hypothetical protein QM679_12635 [Patulibacter sp.]
MPRRPLRALVAVSAALAAMALAGCFQIIGQSTVQQGDIGDLTVTTEMCLTNGVAGCSAGLSDTLTDGDLQYLFGYLVPTWASEPAAVQWTGDAGDQTLARDVAYENILQGFAPAPLGLHWVGYSSGRRTPPPVGVDQRMRAVAQIGLPGDSAPGVLSLATVTGWRVVRDASGAKPALAIDRAYNCNETNDGVPTTVCILSGEPVQSTTPGQTPTANDIAISTLALGAPADVSARAGNVATIKFPQASNYSGDGNDTIAMKVTTTLPGAKIEAPPALILGASTLPSEVRVTVPLVAQTGDYTVTLQTADGQRKATANLHVTGIRTLIGPVIAASVTSIKDSAKQLRKYLRETDASEVRRGNTFDLPVALPAAGTVRGTLVGKLSTHGSKRTLGSGTATLKIPGTATIHLVTTTAARTALRRGRTLRGTLTLRYTRRGKSKSTSAHLTVALK